MPLPPYYLEVVMVGGVACYSTVVMDSRGGLQVLFVSFTKGPGGFPYVLLVSRFPSDLMKYTVVDESLSSFKPMYCSREYQASTRLIQQYEKSTLNYTPRIWDRGQALT